MLWLITLGPWSQPVCEWALLWMHINSWQWRYSSLAPQARFRNRLRVTSPHDIVQHQPWFCVDSDNGLLSLGGLVPCVLLVPCSVAGSIRILVFSRFGSPCSSIWCSTSLHMSWNGCKSKIRNKWCCVMLKQTIQSQICQCIHAAWFGETL